MQGTPVAVFQHYGGAKALTGRGERFRCGARTPSRHVHYHPIYSESQKEKQNVKKRNSSFWFLFTWTIPSNTVNGPIGVTLHSLLSGIEHHRLVGLKPVVGIRSKQLFLGGKVAH